MNLLVLVTTLGAIVSTAALEWFRVDLLGLPRWVWGVVVVLEGLSWLLGRAKNPQLRSLSSAFAKLLSWVLRKFRVSLIPVMGPRLIDILEVIACRDLDGDGNIGTAVTRYPPPDITGANGPGRS